MRKEAAAMIDAALVAYPGSAQAHRAKAAALAAEPSDRYRRQVQDRMRAVRRAGALHEGARFCKAGPRVYGKGCRRAAGIGAAAHLLPAAPRARAWIP